MANEQNLKPFKAGDPRINRLGRPKNFDGLRELARAIAHEPAHDKNGNPVVINGKVATLTEAVLRRWIMSGDPRQQQAAIEIAYGKVPQVTHVSGPDGGPVMLQVVEQIVVARDSDGEAE